MLCVFGVYAVNGIMFFLAALLFLGVVFDLDKYIFPWQTHFFVVLS